MKLMDRNKADGLYQCQFPGYGIISECCEMLPLGETTPRVDGILCVISYNYL